MIGILINPTNAPVIGEGTAARPDWSWLIRERVPEGFSSPVLVHDQPPFTFRGPDYWQGLDAALALRPVPAWWLYVGPPREVRLGAESVLALEMIRGAGVSVLCIDAAGDEPEGTIHDELAGAAEEMGMFAACEQYPYLDLGHWVRRGGIAQSWNVPPRQAKRLRATPRMIHAAGGVCGVMIAHPTREAAQNGDALNPKWIARAAAQHQRLRPWVQVFAAGAAVTGA